MIKFQTKLNSNSTSSLNKFAMKKLTPLYIVLTLLFVCIGVFNLTLGDRDLFSGIFFIVLGVLFFPLNLILVKIIQKKRDDSMAVLSDETLVNFTFYDDRVVIEESRFEDYKSTTEMSYKYYYKVCETDTHYFLYISEHQCQVISKADLTEGSLEDLNLILFRNLGPKKFILKRK